MSERPDFNKLRAERDAAMEKFMADIRKTFAEKWGCDPNELFVHVSGGQGCYCDCAGGGPCEHEFEGWREFEDGCGGETFCKHCGLGAMGHGMWLE